MLSCSLYDRYIFTTILSNSIISRERKTVVSTRKNHRVFINAKQSFSCSSSSVNSRTDSRKSVHYNSLKSLEWDKLCESVASFARSSLGRDATKAQLWSLNQTFEESLKLLDETNAAIEMHKHGIFNLDLTGTDLTLVKSATRHARSSHPLQASEALALVTLLQFVDALQLNMKAALKEDADRCKKFMPLTDMIMQLIISRPLIQLIEQVVDEDGYVKDSASSPLKRARDQVRTLERKDIQSHSTSRSLVLLDEVGAGTNPLEGAALGMSLLEHFSENGALLTIATTHHGELKTLKYSNAYFENACMEFDEVNLKPTYKILWGVPGRSNAINIAERLKLPSIVIDDARKLYGATSAEINEVIIDMERFKQDFQELLYDARRYLMISRELYENLVHARNRIMEHANYQAYEKVRAISAVGARARSVVHNKVRQIRASATQSSQLSTEKKRQTRLPSNSQHTVADTYKDASYGEATLPSKSENSVKRTTLPKIGDMVRVSSLGVKATVLKVEPSKKEVIVKVGNMSMKLKLVDVVM